MNTRNLVIGLIVVAVVIVGGIWLYDAVLGDTEDASGPIAAPTLALATPTEVVVEPTQAAPTQAPEATEATMSDNPEPTEESAPAEDAADSDDSTIGLTVYQITQEAAQPYASSWLAGVGLALVFLLLAVGLGTVLYRRRRNY